MREVEKRVDGMRKVKETKPTTQAKLSNRPPPSPCHAPANRTSRRSPRPRPPDVRPHRHGVPDGPYARRHAPLLARDLVRRSIYPFIDVKDGHHAASHDNNSDAYERIAHFHFEPVGLSPHGKLDSMPEGNGTVLDDLPALM